MYKNSIPWLFTAAIFVGLLLPALVQQGMFLDGVTYACISRNLANGLGSFASPHYTDSLYPVFHEQPPLVFGIQSLFFRVFGDHFWVERLYSFCMAILTAMGIVLNWRLFNPGQKDHDYSWFPILIWITAPIVFWSYQHNMLECTMSVFVLFSTFFAIKSVREGKTTWLFVSAVLTTAAVLCKGPVGFFPVAAPLMAGIVLQPEKKLAATGQSLFMLTWVAIFLGGMMVLVPGMNVYFHDYLQTRLLPTLAGTRDEAVDNRLHFLLDLVTQFLVPIACLLVLFIVRKIRSVTVSKPASFFFLMGMAGTLPLVLSPKQSAHYMLPAIPYFALGLGAMVATSLTPDNGSKHFFLIRHTALLEKTGWLVLVATFTGSLFFWGKFRREASLIQDVLAIGEVVSGNVVITVPPAFSSNWSLISYFGRMNNISLDSRQTHDFFLAENGHQPPEPFDPEPVKTSALHYQLWHKK